MAQIVLAIECDNEHLSAIREPMQTRCTTCGDVLEDVAELQRSALSYMTGEVFMSSFDTPEEALRHYKAADAALAREEKAKRDAAKAAPVKKAASKTAY
jgi:hypothetical protein